MCVGFRNGGEGGGGGLVFTSHDALLTWLPSVTASPLEYWTGTDLEDNLTVPHDQQGHPQTEKTQDHLDGESSV